MKSETSTTGFVPQVEIETRHPNPAVKGFVQNHLDRFVAGDGRNRHTAGPALLNVNETVNQPGDRGVIAEAVRVAVRVDQIDDGRRTGGQVGAVLVGGDVDRNQSPRFTNVFADLDGQRFRNESHFRVGDVAGLRDQPNVRQIDL